MCPHKPLSPFALYKYPSADAQPSSISRHSSPHSNFFMRFPSYGDFCLHDTSLAPVSQALRRNCYNSKGRENESPCPY